jgi:hypothetical protein
MGTTLAWKYWTRMEVAACDKHIFFAVPITNECLEVVALAELRTWDKFSALGEAVCVGNQFFGPAAKRPTLKLKT